MSASAPSHTDRQAERIVQRCFPFHSCSPLPRPHDGRPHDHGTTRSSTSSVCTRIRLEVVFCTLDCCAGCQVPRLPVHHSPSTTPRPSTSPCYGARGHEGTQGTPCGGSPGHSPVQRDDAALVAALATPVAAAESSAAAVAAAAAAQPSPSPPPPSLTLPLSSLLRTAIQFSASNCEAEYGWRPEQLFVTCYRSGALPDGSPIRPLGEEAVGPWGHFGRMLDSTGSLTLTLTLTAGPALSDAGARSACPALSAVEPDTGLRHDEASKLTPTPAPTPNPHPNPYP